jgi:hypothetical protein
MSKILNSICNLRKFEKEQADYKKALKKQEQRATVIKIKKKPLVNPIQQLAEDDNFNELIAEIKKIEENYKENYKEKTVTNKKGQNKWDSIIDYIMDQSIILDSVDVIDKKGKSITSLSFDKKIDYKKVKVIRVVGKTEGGFRITKFLATPERVRK